jgi:hypothetical protein
MVLGLEERNLKASHGGAEQHDGSALPLFLVGLEFEFRAPHLQSKPSTA